MKKTILIGMLLLGTAPALWGGSTNTQKAQESYQGALMAYLDGDYDKAVLMDSQALQLDPQLDKAANLLNILTSEMNKAHQTDIWIGTKSGGTQVAPPVPVTPLVPVKERIVRSKPLGGAKLSQLQAQFRIVGLLMSRNAEEQAKILQMARRAPEAKLDPKMPSYMQVLCGLALLLATLSLVVSMKTRHELKKYRDHIMAKNTHEMPGMDKIVPIRGFGR